MPACPVCEQDVAGGEQELALHVNAHFDNEDESDVEVVGFSGPTAGTVTPPTDTCFVCGANLERFDGLAANAHVNACLDGGAGGAPAPELGPEDFENYEDDDHYDVQREHDDHDEMMSVTRQGRKIKDVEWDGRVFADKRGSSDQAAKGDKWWDPVHGSLGAGAVPPNISPGLIPRLHDMLDRSVSSGSTRGAVLARNAVHIKGSFGFDSTWGCGYRNAMMAIATLYTTYPSVFSQRGDPGVRAIQNWIEEAWRAGFDMQGRQQLKGKVSGTQKWIGTTDLYAMFSWMGIPCVLYDFNKPSDRATDEPTHTILERWVRNYFDDDEEHEDEVDAFDELMRPKVRIGSKFPFILQHAGHSRTVVGYELVGKDMNLIIFDPGKPVPTDVRNAGIAALRADRASSTAASTAAESSRKAGVSIRENDAAANPSSDEEVRQGGWVRKKVKKAVGKSHDPLLSSLDRFRTNLGRWKHNQFQVLAFPGTEVLSPAERNARKVVDSVDVQR